MRRNYSINEINAAVKADAASFVNECAQNYEQRINTAVKNILDNKNIDIVMLAGPSSSGKTTTANKLAQGIIKNGKQAYIISLDDFYYNRDEIAINKDGLPDFENVNALDIPLIRQTFKSLIEKRAAVLPVFNFNTGRREEQGKLIKLSENDVVIVEGIHALNPIFTQGVEANHIYKIYISVSSRLTKDGKVLMTKRNIRFVRRMIRDYHFRSSPVEHTYFLWGGVRKGEDRFIFPFKGQANEFINSMHPFEICLFRNEAVELLGHIDEDSLYFDEMQRLKEAVEQFEPIDEALIGKDSLLREFIG